jgi:Mg2+ and Co2+ transporter CorA
VFLLPAGCLRADSCLQEEKRALAASRDNLDRLYRDANNSLTILERSHRFTMADLDNHRYKLQESQDELIRVRQLVSSKDSVIKDLCASKRSVVQELEAVRLAVKAAEDTSTTLKAQRDKAMEKPFARGGS